jgi:hypothetical protein
VENNSPAKVGLVGGKLLDLYKRGRKTQNKGGKIRAKTESRNIEQKNKTQKREGKVKEQDI